MASNESGGGIVTDTSYVQLGRKQGDEAAAAAGAVDTPERPSPLPSGDTKSQEVYSTAAETPTQRPRGSSLFASFRSPSFSKRTPSSSAKKMSRKESGNTLSAVDRERIGDHLEFDPEQSDPLSSRLIHRLMFAEFIGSLFFNLISQGAVIASGSLTYQFNYDQLSPGRILCIAFSTTFAQASLLYSIIPLASFNGHPVETQPGDDHHDYYALNRQQYIAGHLNPAITFAMYLLKEIKFGQLCQFWVAQFFGSACASIILVMSIPDAANSQIGATILAKDVHWYQGLLMETILTCFLVFSAYNFMVKAPKGFMVENAPFLYSLSYLACFLVGCSVSGASMNPARSFGPSLISGTWKHHAIYWVGPFAGAAIAAAMIYRLHRPTYRQNAFEFVNEKRRFPVVYDHEWTEIDRFGLLLKRRATGKKTAGPLHTSRSSRFLRAFKESTASKTE